MHIYLHNKYLSMNSLNNDSSHSIILYTNLRHTNFLGCILPTLIAYMYKPKKRISLSQRNPTVHQVKKQNNSFPKTRFIKLLFRILCSKLNG